MLLDPEAPFRAWGQGFVRPIELWRARHWERPDSATVLRYSLDDVVEQAALPGDVVTRNTIVEFLSDVSAYRLGALGILLDAVDQALSGGPPVVIATPTTDEGAMWIGAVSFFAAPATCLRMSFSTHENLADVLAAAVAGYHKAPMISVVPQQEIAALTRRSAMNGPRGAPEQLPVTVVDPRVEAHLAASGGVEYRENHLGQRVRVTDWSRLALDVCCEESIRVLRVFSELDRISVSSHLQAHWDGRSWHGEVGTAWPLAAAVAVCGGFSLAMPTATRVLLRDTPESVRRGGELASTVSSLVSATVHDVDDAWARLQHTLQSETATTTLVQAAFESYLTLALADDAWLARPAPLPDAVPVDRGFATRFHEPVAAALVRVRSERSRRLVTEAAAVERGVQVLRTMDVLDRLEQLVGDLDLMRAGMRDLASEGAEWLTSQLGAQIAEVVGILDPRSVRRWLVPAVRAVQRDWSGPAGDRLPAAVTGLLAAASDVEHLLTMPEPAALAQDAVAVEIVVAAASGRVVSDVRLRGPALEYLLWDLARARVPRGPTDPTEAVERIFAQLDGGYSWNAAELLRILDRVDHALAPSLVPAAIRRVGQWGRDGAAGRLAAGLLKFVELLPPRHSDGRPRPRRAGVTDADIDLLNFLSTIGPGWAVQDDGLPRRAAELLYWADRAWGGLSEHARDVIAHHVVVASFQTALAAELDGSPDLLGARLRSRLGVVPRGDAWRECIGIGLDEAVPMLISVFALNRYRLVGELVCAATRAMLGVPSPVGDAVPPLVDLPIGPVVRSVVVAPESPPELLDHLAGLVEQEIAAQDAPASEARRMVAFWSRVLPGGNFGAYTLSPALATQTHRGITAGEVPPPRRRRRSINQVAREWSRRFGDEWTIELPPAWLRRPRRWLRRRRRRVPDGERRPGGTSRP